MDKQHFWAYRGAETSLLYNIRCVVISRIATDLSNLNDVIRWITFITNPCTLVSICSSRLSILSPLTFWARIPLRRGVLDTTLCDKVCQWHAAGRKFSLGTLVSSTNKTDRHDITEILLKVTVNTITPNSTTKWR